MMAIMVSRSNHLGQHIDHRQRIALPGCDPMGDDLTKKSTEKPQIGGDTDGEPPRTLGRVGLVGGR